MSPRDIFRRLFRRSTSTRFAEEVAEQAAAAVVPDGSTVRAVFAVQYKTEVLQPRKVLGVPYWRPKVVRSRGWKRNLVLDVGLDMPAASAICACFSYLALGTGSAPTKRDSGTIMAAKVGGTITAAAEFFVPADVGRLFRFDTGQEYKVTGYTSATVVSTAETDNVPSSEFTVWHTSDTGHQAEFYRGSSVDTTAGNNKSTFLAGVWTHQRVFLTPVFAAARTVSEIGWSNSGTAGASLFGRDLVGAGGDFVDVGQQYRGTVQLAVSYGPDGVTAPAAQADVGTNGYNTTGQYAIEGARVSQVGSDGGAEAYTDTGGNYRTRFEFAGNTPGTITVTTSSVALRAVAATEPSNGAAVGTQVSNNAYPIAYASGSYFRDFQATLSATQAVGTTHRSICFSVAAASTCAMRVLLAASQAKANTHKLILRARFGWGRILQN